MPKSFDTNKPQRMARTIAQQPKSVADDPAFHRAQSLVTQLTEADVHQDETSTKTQGAVDLHAAPTNERSEQPPSHEDQAPESAPVVEARNASPVIAAPAVPAVKPKPVSAPVRAIVPANGGGATSSALHRKTAYPDDACRKRLRKMLRTYKMPEAYVVEFALLVLFRELDNDAIAAPMRAAGMGLRRTRVAGAQPRKTLSIYVDEDSKNRLEALRDDFEVAEGLVCDYALNKLFATRTDEEIVNQIRADGFLERRRRDSAARPVA